MHCNWTFKLQHIWLSFSWCLYGHFPREHNEEKHEAVLNAFRKRGSKYEPEGSKQWRKFWPSVKLLHIFMWDSTFKALNFPGVLGLLTVTASQSHRSPDEPSMVHGLEEFHGSPRESSSIEYLFTLVLSHMPLFLPFYPNNTTKLAWCRWLKNQELTGTMARSLDWLCLAWEKGGV